MGLFCIFIPCAIAFYILRYAEAYYRVYEYHKWRRNETALRVRLLSAAVLPVGRWEPSSMRRRLGATMTNQCRPEFVWMLLPVASPTAVALFALVRNQSERVCVWVYLALAALHIVLFFVVLICKPLRTGLENWLKLATLLVMALYAVFTAVQLIDRHSALRIVLAVVPVVLLALTVVWAVYNFCHVFIARRIATAVPSRVLFEWNRGSALTEDLSGGGNGCLQESLYSELDELLLLGNDTGVLDCVDEGTETFGQLPDSHVRPLQGVSLGDEDGIQNDDIDDLLRGWR